MLHQLIMAGGSGTRFWPLSRKARPKQLLSLDGGPTLLAQAASRLAGVVPPGRVRVVTTEAQAPLVRLALPDVPPGNVIAEPAGRDTAAALGLGAAAIAREDPDAILVAMPADHLLKPVSRFQATVQAAARVLELCPDAVVTIGVQPDHPATAYGYIERGAALRETLPPEKRDARARAILGAAPIYSVKRFREKPDRATAEAFLAQGGFYWNAGIFVWRARALLAALDRFLPETAAVLRLEGDALEAAWLDLPKISIDFAVLEKHPEVVVVEADFAWSDVGSWTALPAIHGADADGNCAVGATHLHHQSRGVLAVGTGDGRRVIATVGLEDVVIVDTEDALLVCPKGRVEDVKRLVERLERDGRASIL
jgi:mannose-1-phosphate guanylyltransferase